MTQNQYGGTTVFVPEQEQAASGNAFLVRKRTGERIEIKGAEFVIGKDPSQTDYYITGNSAISRVHAVIICKGKQYDVADKNATNGTFVNDVKVSAVRFLTRKTLPLAACSCSGTKTVVVKEGVVRSLFWAHNH